MLSTRRASRPVLVRGNGSTSTRFADRQLNQSILRLLTNPHHPLLSLHPPLIDSRPSSISSLSPSIVTHSLTSLRKNSTVNRSPHQTKKHRSEKKVTTSNNKTPTRKEGHYETRILTPAFTSSFLLVSGCHQTTLPVPSLFPLHRPFITRDNNSHYTGQ